MKTKIKRQKLIFSILFFIFIFIYALSNSGNYLDHDLGWHIRVGEEIYKHQQVPQAEIMNYPILGEEYIDHEWLINFLIYFIYNNFGYTALQIFFALIIAITLILLVWFVNKNFHADIFSLYPLLTLGLLSMSPHIGVRVQEISLLFLIILLIIIHQYEKRARYKILFWLPPLFWLWANLHGGFLIGLFICGFWLVVKILEKIIKRINFFDFLNYQNLPDSKNILFFLIAFLTSIIATFFTPYYFKLYSLLADYGNTYYMQHIIEWLPPWHIPINYYSLLYSVISAIALASIIINIFKKTKKKYKINLWYFSLSLGFFLLSFKSKRHFPLFFIVSLPFLIDYLIHTFRFTKEEIQSIIAQNLFNEFIYKNFKLISIGFIFILTISFSLKIYLSPDPFNDKYYCYQFPCKAIEFIQQSPHQDKKFFNNYGWGGFITKVWPEKPIFIDGKQPQKNYQGHTFLEEYYEFFKESKAEEMLNKHGIQMVLIKKFIPLNYNWFEKIVFGMSEEIDLEKNKNHLLEYLQQNPGWSLIFEDKISVVFVKN